MNRVVKKWDKNSNPFFVIELKKNQKRKNTEKLSQFSWRRTVEENVSDAKDSDEEDENPEITGVNDVWK